MFRSLISHTFQKRIAFSHARIVGLNHLYRFYNAPTFITADQVIGLYDENNTEKKDIIFVDVRQPEKYQQGSIDGAVNIHDIFTYLLPQSTDKDLEAMKLHFTQLLLDNNIHCTDNEHVVIYEDDLTKLYGSSCRGYFIFKYMGHPHVSVLQGGYQGVLKLSESEQKQLKATNNITDKDDVNMTNFKYNDKWMCGKEDVLNVLNGKRKAHLLDVRDEIEWDGSSSSPYGKDFTPRRGRIPNAKWIEWYDFMQDGKIKNKQEIEQMMKAQGIDKDDDIIIYCFKGSRASNTLMILNECGYNNVSNYFASWNEWSRNMELPIDDQPLKVNKQ